MKTINIKILHFDIYLSGFKLKSFFFITMVFKWPKWLVKTVQHHWHINFAPKKKQVSLCEKVVFVLFFTNRPPGQKWPNAKTVLEKSPGIQCSKGHYNYRKLGICHHILLLKPQSKQHFQGIQFCFSFENLMKPVWAGFLRTHVVCAIISPLWRQASKSLWWQLTIVSISVWFQQLISQTKNINYIIYLNFIMNIFVVFLNLYSHITFTRNLTSMCVYLVRFATARWWDFHAR